MVRLAAALAMVGWLVFASRLLAQPVGFSVSFGTGWPAYGSWAAPYPYSYWYGGLHPGPMVLPPLYLPAETMYGPLAMQRFMGIDRAAPTVPPVIIANNAVGHLQNQAPAKPKVRTSNAAMKEQAGKLMAFGDANFAKQNYNSALERYRRASSIAPDVPETFLRQAFALVAIGRYESAAKVTRRALLIAPTPIRWKFRLDDLYQANQMAKSAHVESLAQAVDQNPQSADMLMLLGVQLFFDGQAERAHLLFRRCEQLGGNEDGAISPFLRNPKWRDVMFAEEI